MEIRKITDVRNEHDEVQAEITKNLIEASKSYYNGNAKMSDITADR